MNARTRIDELFEGLFDKPVGRRQFLKTIGLGVGGLLGLSKIDPGDEAAVEAEAEAEGEGILTRGDALIKKLWNDLDLDNWKGPAATVNARQVIEAVYGQPSRLYGRGPRGAEWIVAAALRDDDTGHVFLGDYHAAIKKAAMRRFPSAFLDDGFWTSQGRFVDRGEALALARKNRQGNTAAHHRVGELDSISMLPAGTIPGTFLRGGSQGPAMEAVHGRPSGLYGQPEDSREWIVAAAIRNQATGDMYLGDDHQECTSAAGLTKETWPGWEDGFYTSRGNFLTRKEAFTLANQSDQYWSMGDDKNELDAFDVLETVHGSPSSLYGKPEGDAEWVIAAAIKDRATGDIYLGDYHSDCGVPDTCESS
jgi:hypothetical protein